MKGRDRSIRSVSLVGDLDDLDRAAARWIGQFGVGPWTVFRNEELEGEYQGAPTRSGWTSLSGIRAKCRSTWIAVADDVPSPYRTAAGERLRGLHHLARLVDDLDATVTRPRHVG